MSDGAPRRTRRALAWLLPSVVGVILAVALAGFIDGYVTTGDAWRSLAAAGFLSLVAVPACLLCTLLARGLWYAWQPRALAASFIEEGGGAPRLCAWVLFLVGSAWALAGITFNIVHQLQHATSARGVISLAAALLVTAAVAGIFIVSRPCVRLLTALLCRVDRGFLRRRGKSLFTIAFTVTLGSLLLGALMMGAWWISIRPRIGHLDVFFVYYLALAVAVLAIVHGAWRRLRQRRALAAGVSGAALVVGILVLGAAFYARHLRPYTLIEVWADTRLAGGAIDLLHDVQELRRDIRIREVRPTRREGATNLDVILITIDTLRADRTALYGGSSSVMPHLTQLGSEGTVFERAYAPGNVTRRSLPAIATGLHPPRVRGRVAGWALRIDPRHIMLAERFRVAGYDTAGFFCCASHFGPEHRLGLIRGIDHLVIEKDGALLSEHARQWVAARDASSPRRPLFMWVHFIEPHLWQEDYPVKTYGASMGARYDHSLNATDRFLRTVLQAVWTEQRKESTIVAVSSDHGEGLGDHGHRTHATSLYNSEIHVPLIFAGPNVQRQRIGQAVGLIHIAPTLLDLAGFEPPDASHMDGRSLAPLVRGEREDDPEGGEAYSLMMQDRSVAHDVHALVLGRYKYIEHSATGEFELYDVRDDPREARNLAGEPDRAALLQRMRARLEALRQEMAEPPF